MKVKNLYLKNSSRANCAIVERTYGRVNDSNLIKETSCKKVRTCISLSAIIYEFNALTYSCAAFGKIFNLFIYCLIKTNFLHW